MASRSSRGRTIRSLAVWMTRDGVGLLADDSGDQSAVGGRQIRERVVAAHGGARVQDVFEDVVGIGTVRAGQLGADVAAGVVEPVARKAGSVENGPASRRVGRLVSIGSEHRLVLGHQGGFCLRGRLDLAPDGFESLVDPPIGEGLQLAGDGDAHVAAGDLPTLDGLEQRQRPRWAGGQGGDRIVALGRGVLAITTAGRSRAWRDRRRPPVPRSAGPRSAGSSSKACRSGASPGTRRSTRADNARFRRSSRVVAVERQSPAAPRRPSAPAQSSASSRDCSTTFRSGRATSRAKAAGQPSGRATCLRPRRASWAPIKRSTQTASSAVSSSETIAARPAAGSADTALRATNRRTIGIWQRAAQRHGPLAIGPAPSGSTPYQIIEREHPVRGVLRVARERLGDRPALVERKALQRRGQAQPDFRAGIGLGQLREPRHRGRLPADRHRTSRRTAQARTCSLG